MKKAILYFIGILFLLTVVGCNSPDNVKCGDTIIIQDNGNNPELVEEITSSVVTIFAGEMQGSGVCISNDKIVTNFHVISSVQDGETIIIKTKNGSLLFASSILAADPTNDLAVLQILGTAPSVAKIGNSDDIKQGDTVYAVGSPAGLENTITDGIINNVKLEIIPNYFGFQHSASIDHGSSGGGLFDKISGELIGINTAGIDEIKLEFGFAIPINIVKPLLGISTPKMKFKENEEFKKKIMQKYNVATNESIDGSKVHFLFSKIDSALKRWMMFFSFFIIGYFWSFLSFISGLKKGFTPAVRMSRSYIIIAIFIIAGLLFSFSDLIWSKTTTVEKESTEEIIG